MTAHGNIVDQKVASVGDAVQLYLKNHIGHTAIDTQRAEVAWKNMAVSLQNVPLHSLNGHTLSTYMANRKASAGTINRELGVLSAAIRWCYAQGYTDKLVLVPVSPLHHPVRGGYPRRSATGCLLLRVPIPTSGRSLLWPC